MFTISTEDADMDDTTDNLFEKLQNGTLDEISSVFNNATINEVNEDNLTPLQHVVQSERNDACDVIDVLVEHGADVNAISMNDGNTAVHLAVITQPLRKAFPLVVKLMAHNADTSIRNKSLRTPYDCAIARRFDDVLPVFDGSMSAEQALQEYNQKVKKTYGEILIDAVYNSDEGKIKECLENNADTNLVNKHGAGAIHYSVTHCQLQTLPLLSDLVQQHGADVNLKDYEGDTALNLVIKTEKYRNEPNAMHDLASRLLEWGTDTTIKDLDGRDAFMLAEKRGYSDIMELLQGRDNTSISHSPEEPIEL